MSEVEKAFRRFAVYGDTPGSVNSMTAKNFSKMMEECDVMDGKCVTSTDVDVIFNKIKHKGARHINYIEFLQGIKKLSGKRFSGKEPEEAFHSMIKLMEGKEPSDLEAAVRATVLENGEGMADLEAAFRKFAVFGDTSASSNEMTTKNFSKMMKECGVMDGKLVTSTDVDILFSKVKTKGAQKITYPEFLEALKDLSVKRFKGKSPEEALQATHKLIEGKEPCLVGATKSVTAGGVQRLTDTSKYTGSHKERFDDSGKGKGIAGRADLKENTGYVGAYKGSGTYDKSH